MRNCLNKLVLFYVVLALCASCHARDEQNYKIQTGMRFQLQEPMFVYDFGSSGGLTLKRPGSFGGVPSSVESYEDSPDNWMQSQEYLARYGQPFQGWPSNVKGLVPAGTIIEVVKVKGRNNYTLGPITDIWVRIEDPRWQGVVIEIGSGVETSVGRPEEIQPSKALKRIN